MSIHNMYQGETISKGESGTTRVITYTGSRSDLQTVMNGLTVGTSESNGERITKAALSQKDGSIWKLEITYTDEHNGDSYSTAPNTAYGQKSATLECSCVAIPLEAFNTYLKKWNHYLIAAYQGNTEPTLPNWWNTARYSDQISSSDSKKYRWVKDKSECPSETDENGYRWKVLKNPTKIGINYVDVATYRIVESVKCPSAASAGTYAANIINKISTPNERFGIKKTAGNWRCDSASISWDGKNWIATMAYTMSCDANGWDTDLYGTNVKIKHNQL